MAAPLTLAATMILAMTFPAALAMAATMTVTMAAGAALPVAAAINRHASRSHIKMLSEGNARRCGERGGNQEGR